MATTTEINNLADTIATEQNTQRNNMPQSMMKPEKMNEMTVHMAKGQAKAILTAFNPPWENVMATGQSSPDRATLAKGWFNRGTGWCEGGSRRIPALGLVQLRGVLYTNATESLVMTLPVNLRPRKNELFSITVGTFAGFVYVWTDGVVAIDEWPERTLYAAAPIPYLSLSGIQYEAQV